MTDIFGAISLSSVLLAGKQGKLLIFSDMRHCTKDFNLEQPPSIEYEKILPKVMKAGLIPHLEGARVWCLGVHSVGKTPAYWQGLRSFWTRYFEKAGVKELTYSMERRFK
jgi:hypothetical protein